MRSGLALLACSLLALPARAVDHPQEAVKLRLVVNRNSGRSKAVWAARIPPPSLSGLLPTTTGATFVVTAGGGAKTSSTPLPATGWRANAAATVYKFVNRDAPTGPSRVKVAKI
jgi:hypothetical protein